MQSYSETRLYEQISGIGFFTAPYWDAPGPLGRTGVDDGDRTHDHRSHNPVLYQLSYVHHRKSVATLPGTIPR